MTVVVLVIVVLVLLRFGPGWVQSFLDARRSDPLPPLPRNREYEEYFEAAERASRQLEREGTWPPPPHERGR